MLKKEIGNKAYVVKGILLAFMITIALIIIFSLLIMFTDIKEGKIPLLNNIAMITSIAISSIYVAFKIKVKGWMQGGLVGIGYCVILLLLNVIFIKPIQFDLISGTRLVLATITGIIGGMIGINLS